MISDTFMLFLMFDVKIEGNSYKFYYDYYYFFELKYY